MAVFIEIIFRKARIKYINTSIRSILSFSEKIKPCSFYVAETGFESISDSKPVESRKSN